MTGRECQQSLNSALHDLLVWAGPRLSSSAVIPSCCPGELIKTEITIGFRISNRAASSHRDGNEVEGGPVRKGT